MKKTVLLYNFDAAEQAAAKRALLPLHFSVRVISGEEMLLPVGYLASLTDDDTKRDYSTDTFGMLVVMGGFLGSDVDKLLSAMRKAGFGRDVLKAVITPTNAVWCGGELYAEILREHEQMRKK